MEHTSRRVAIVAGTLLSIAKSHKYGKRWKVHVQDDERGYRYAFVTWGDLLALAGSALTQVEDVKPKKKAKRK